MHLRGFFACVLDRLGADASKIFDSPASSGEVDSTMGAREASKWPSCAPGADEWLSLVDHPDGTIVSGYRLSAQRSSPSGRETRHAMHVPSHVRCISSRETTWSQDFFFLELKDLFNQEHFTERSNTLDTVRISLIGQNPLSELKQRNIKGLFCLFKASLAR